MATQTPYEQPCAQCGGHGPHRNVGHAYTRPTIERRVLTDRRIREEQVPEPLRPTVARIQAAANRMVQDAIVLGMSPAKTREIIDARDAAIAAVLR